MENIEKGELITTGKAKSLYTSSKEDYLVMHYRDDTSAFDGKKIESLEIDVRTFTYFSAFVSDLGSQWDDLHTKENGEVRESR